MNPSTETSGKPDDIPHDVWDSAAKCADEYARWLHAGNSSGVLSDHAEQGLADTIARTILAAKAEEREACAQLAEVERRSDLALKHGYKPTWHVVAQEIASAIRKRGEG